MRSLYRIACLGLSRLRHPGVAVAAAPQADTIDLDVPTQLPRTAIPHHYAIRYRSTRRCVDVRRNGGDQPRGHKADNEPGSQRRQSELREGDAKRQRRAAGRPRSRPTRTRRPRPLNSAGRSRPDSYRLKIDYSGKINTQANGLFALDYKNPAGAQKRAIFTQFEPADARRFFPSWDEPDYKATFDLTARVPAGEMAVSNMPAAASRDVGDGLKEVTFRQLRPCRPTCCSSAPASSAESPRWRATPKSASSWAAAINRKARTALDAEAQILPYYNQYFGTPFPLPKLDNVAGPGQSQFFSAMENWGAIFTFERVLLDDPAVTTERERQAIFGVEAHEMAHQWFGDLVTMAWWDDLWLNEGFASWMASKATEHFHPEWGAEFGAVGAREGAMGRTRSPPHTRSSSTFAPLSRPIRPSTRSPIRRANLSSPCSRAMPARKPGSVASRPISARTNIRIRALTICGGRWKQQAPRASRKSRTISRSNPAFR